MQAGKYRDRCRFFRPALVDDGFGNKTNGYQAEPFLRCRGHVQEQRGRERIEGGQTTSLVLGTLKIYSSELSRTIAPEADKVTIAAADGTWIDYQIRAVANHDRRNKELELVIERGVAI